MYYVTSVLVGALLVSTQCNERTQDDEIARDANRPFTPLASVSPSPSSEPLAPTPTDEPPPTPNPSPTIPPVHFIALGDAGTGEAGQMLVAQALATTCGSRPCDFAILLGDNFYPAGVSSTDDPQWETKFVVPYADLPFPFYAVLGNHDYGTDGYGDQYSLPQHQIAYAENHPDWVLPSRWYVFERGAATLFALSSYLLVRDFERDAQQSFFVEEIAASSLPWRIVLSHHPYLSNGYHGNAGEYDGRLDGSKGSGIHYKEFVDEVLCGNVDLFLSGHDHNLQVLPGTESCPGLFVVSGAGAFSSSTLPGVNPTLFQLDEKGFAYIAVSETQLTIEMIEAKTGTVAFTTTLVK